jgi:hypothetical protein
MAMTKTKEGKVGVCGCVKSLVFLFFPGPTVESVLFSLFHALFLPSLHRHTLR